MLLMRQEPDTFIRLILNSEVFQSYVNCNDFHTGAFTPEKLYRRLHIRSILRKKFPAGVLGPGSKKPDSASSHIKGSLR